jgi:predicted choloylglycine hydrolase
VDEAVELIQSVPHAQSRNYMVVDKTGQMIVVEASIDGIEIRYPEQGVLVMTNHNLCPSYSGKEMILPPDSPIRYDRLRALANNGYSIGITDLKSALNDRENFVCAHGEYEGQSFGTIWSLVGHPDERKLEIAEGRDIGQLQYQIMEF